MLQKKSKLGAMGEWADRHSACVWQRQQREQRKQRVEQNDNYIINAQRTWSEVGTRGKPENMANLKMWERKLH